MTKHVDKENKKYVNETYPKLKAKARTAYKAYTEPSNAKRLELYNTIMSGKSKFSDDLKIYEDNEK